MDKILVNYVNQYAHAFNKSRDDDERDTYSAKEQLVGYVMRLNGFHFDDEKYVKER